VFTPQEAGQPSEYSQRVEALVAAARADMVVLSRRAARKRKSQQKEMSGVLAASDMTRQVKEGLAACGQVVHPCRGLVLAVPSVAALAATC
jgi:hypothetical protein